MPDIGTLEGESEATICVKCKYYFGFINQERSCNSSKAPITNFITGIKECERINIKGNCKFYKKEC